MYQQPFPLIGERIIAKNPLTLTREKLLRIIADVLMINVAVFTSMVVRFVFLVAFERTTTEADYGRIFWKFLINYRNNAWLLTLICLAVFSIAGIYSHTRAYRGRYKALVVGHAVSLAYLLFAVFSYFIGGVFELPRGALLLAWILSTTMLLGARAWATMWSSVVRSEVDRSKKMRAREERTILLIGGAGYIGSALLPKLLDKGYRVRLLDLLLYGSEPIQDVLNHPKLEVVQADFRSVDKVVEAMHDIESVIHLGAIVGDPACALDEELTIEVNLMATRMIAEVAKGSGVNRFIFASTCSVYGASREILDERSCLNPVSLYARSKIASERVLLSMAESSFSPTLLRFGTIYGLSGRTRFDLVVNLITAKALIDGQITIVGGDQWRPFLHVDDAALAIFKCLEAPLPMVRNQTFNVGSNDQNYTLSQVGELVHSLVPSAEVIDLNSDTDPRNYRVNFNKIRNTLNFAPKWTLEQGVRQVMEAIESGKITDYQDTQFSNVKFLSDLGACRLPRQNGWAYQLIREAVFTSPPWGSSPNLEVMVGD
jgi:nucleoside-diphosphate-sugar epimerase